MFDTKFFVTPEILIGLMVAGMSLFFDYFPVVAKKFNALQPDAKKLIVLIGSILIGTVVFVGPCYGWFETNISCTYSSGMRLLYNIIVAVAMSYGFHNQTKPSITMKKKLFK